MKRTILAYLEIDDDLAFEKIDDGPIAYLEKESGWLAQSGIFITDAAIAMLTQLTRKKPISYTLPDSPLSIWATGTFTRCPMSSGDPCNIRNGAQSISAPQSIYQNKGVYEYEQRNLLR